MKWITPSKKERNTVRNFFGGLCLWKDVSADTFSTAVQCSNIIALHHFLWHKICPILEPCVEALQFRRFRGNKRLQKIWVETKHDMIGADKLPRKKTYSLMFNKNEGFLNWDTFIFPQKPGILLSWLCAVNKPGLWVGSKEKTNVFLKK